MSGEVDKPTFFCDAMLGGLARWLRGAGYDARFDGGIDDGVLVRTASAEGRIVLSSDRGIFARNIVKRGIARALFVPRATPPFEQLVFVLRELHLTPCAPRCMACGGGLDEISRGEAEKVTPPRAFAEHDRFWRCDGCKKIYWHGTHWSQIRARLAELELRSSPTTTVCLID